MSTNHKWKIKSVISMLIACMMVIGMIPTTYAAQSNEYVDLLHTEFLNIQKPEKLHLTEV